MNFFSIHFIGARVCSLRASITKYGDH